MSFDSLLSGSVCPHLRQLRTRTNSGASLTVALITRLFINDSNPPPLHNPSVAYTGKFNYWKNALNENIYVIFPQGITPNGLVYIFSTWTKTASGSEKAGIQSATPMVLDAFKTTFVADTGYYTWKGKTSDGWKTFDLEIWHGTEEKPRSTQTLTLFPQSQ